MAVRIQMRRGSTSDWNTADPILNEGEIGYNTTLGQIKIGDGSTAWSSLDYMVTDAELNTSLGNYIELTEKGAGNGVAELDSNKNVLTRESVIFEGATTNSYQTTLISVDPTEDRTITLPDSTGTVVVADVSGNVIISGNLTVNGTTTTIDTQNLVVEDKNITIGDVATPTDVTADGGGITLKGTTDKTFNWVDATDSWTSSENINLASGKTYFKNGTDIKDVSETLTNKTISGNNNTITNVANTSLVNSSITINGVAVPLGGSTTVAGDIDGVVAGVGLTGGGTSATVTLDIDTTVVATTNNTLTMSGKTLTNPVVSGLSLSDSSIVFEGSSADDFETTLTVVDPTADRTITLPNVSGTVITSGDSGTVTSTMIADGTIVNSDINASAAIDKTKISGTAITAADTGTVTNAMLAGSIDNNKLTNSTISGVSLGSNLNSLTISTGLSGTSYNGSAAVTISVDSTIATTSSSQTLTNKTLGAGTSLSSDLSAATYKITSLGTPTASTDAATKQYVDDIAQGLHIHASCVTATTNNINLSTDLEAGDVIDGVTLVAGNRVLVKNQSTTSENGIYLAVTSGVAVRASDFDSSSEIQGGDFVFVTGGTVNDNTGWVQVNTVTTVGTDPIVFTQFSGAGTYLAGNGLTLTGNTFSINTGTTVDLSTAQTLTNKTISGSNNTLSNIANSSLTNSSVTVNGTAIALGASGTVTVPVSTGITGLGTGVATALAVNIGTAGAPIVNGGALGTPSSGTLTNVTGLPVTSGISGLGTGVATFLATPSSANLASAITDETGSGLLVFGTSPTVTSALLVEPIVRSPEERWSVSATAATGTINFDAKTSGILYYTSNATGNWTLNIRGDGSNTLNNMLTTNDSITVVFFVTNGATAYYQTAFQIDGSAVTPKWQNGTAPSSGNINSIDIYSYTIVKTGAATFTAFGSQTKFA